MVVVQGLAWSDFQYPRELLLVGSDMAALKPLSLSPCPGGCDDEVEEAAGLLRVIPGSSSYLGQSCVFNLPLTSGIVTLVDFESF